MRDRSEWHSLLGDLHEEFVTRVRPNRSWLGARAWYVRELIAAIFCALRDVRLPRFPHGAAGDFRYALRRWRHRPGFAAAAVITLALGIAATTATFSIVDTVLLRPLPWKDAERLVVVHAVHPARRSNPSYATTWNRGSHSYLAWDALKTSSQFSELAVWSSIPRLDMTFGEERTELVRTASVSSTFLPTLGYRVVRGRNFIEQEDHHNSDSVLITHEMWQHRLGGREDVVNQKLMFGSASSMERRRRTVVGIVEPGFHFEGPPPEVLLPVGIPAAISRKYPSPSLRVVARLAPHTSLESAEAEAISLVRGVRATEPVSARLATVEDEHRGAARKPLWLLFAGSGLLLLIACSNVASLLLGEARVRRHEIGVRSALGAGRWLIVRQLIVEHLMIAILGTLLGVAAAYWLIAGVVTVAPEAVPRLDSVAIDQRVAGFAALAGFATLLLFGAVPAIAAARTEVAPTLAEGSRDGAPSRLVGQRLLVACQISLALVLLTGAGLFAETVFRLTSQPLGFRTENLAVVSTTFTGSRFGSDRARFIAARNGNATSRLLLETENPRTDLVLERIASVPGVTAAAGSSAAPFVLNPLTLLIRIDGATAKEELPALRQVVTSNYFQTMGIAVVQGRGFARGDGNQPVQAAVVSEEFASRYLAAPAIGRRFRYLYGNPAAQEYIDYEVVGVVRDVKRQEYAEDTRPLFYASDRGSAGVTQFVVRASRDVATVLPLIRQAIKEIAPQVVVTDTAVMRTRVARSVAEERFRALLSSLFGATALVLAGVGLYGLVMRRALDRRREFGVRLAIGATPRDVRRLVMSDATSMVAIGIAGGVPAAFVTAQLTQSLLFGVTPASAHVFGLTAIALSAVSVAASLLPARRASRADPIAVLRS